jgi:hypothetical protein
VPAAKPVWFWVVILLLHAKLVALVVSVMLPVCAPAQFVLGVVAEVIVGLTVLLVTVIEAVAVQPFVPVTVTLYVPAAKPVWFWVVVLLLQAKVVALVVSVIVPVDAPAQFVLGVVAEVIVGFTVLLVTVIEAVAVQPFVPVAVTL